MPPLNINHLKMLYAPEDERDDDLDTDDADIENKDSDDEGGDEDDKGDKKGEDSDDSDEDEDDDKPLTRGELKKILKSNKNHDNANRRVSKKSGDTKAPTKDARLESIEQSQKRIELLEQKRTFGYENNLSPDEVEIVYQLTKRPTKKFLELPHVKGAIEGHRSHKNVKLNTPGGSGRTFKADNGKEWKDLSPAEKSSNFANRRRAILESKQK